jgi:hypothetical protein
MRKTPLFFDFRPHYTTVSGAMQTQPEFTTGAAAAYNDNTPNDFTGNERKRSV